ncbi:mu-type opioid receptor-like [Saccoglossus kowalevskii]|uniref:Mu-type opioid receptor-like n=1 Tax=Saccoglossus kowalevskii TaxID=10224 RepID=A0ABM0LYV5_SACKO|nr:PREDICTED: mu-type opioid receptor-like [Saccoglossus kowalevskii]
MGITNFINASFISGTGLAGNSTEADDNFTCGVTGTPLYVGGILICCFGLLFNGAFVFVFTRVRYMKTLTNAYLVNLASSDMLLLLSVLLVYVSILVGRVITRDLNCAINCVHTMLLFVSLWVVTIVSIERYLGICNPLKAMMLKTKGRVMSLICTTWLLGVLFAMPRILQCTVLKSYHAMLQNAEHAVYITYALMFLVAMVTVATMYALTIKTFRQSAMMLRDRKQSKKVKSDEKQVLVTCMAISVVFFICMFPAFYKYLMLVIWNMSGSDESHWHFTICMSALSRWFLLINSSINPLIYTITSKGCRRAFCIAFRYRHYEYMGPMRSTSINGATMMSNVNAGHSGYTYKQRSSSSKEMSV